ncbi:fumarylacetoacetate hydrolase family protein [Streptomyces canus]|uniref:fumarylacetoacetate hydrolase family protein n=1 Tax=Streptomyces canus TaxID=58343 RepID=UPI0038680F55|nr:fumarylacetoacetate hydrolase family protein [Streptomyces canus]
MTPRTSCYASTTRRWRCDQARQHRPTLEPGDVISTGTPGGVGPKQGLFLRSGTEVRIEIEGIGALVNICA